MPLLEVVGTDVDVNSLGIVAVVLGSGRAQSVSVECGSCC